MRRTAIVLRGAAIIGIVAAAVLTMVLPTNGFDVTVVLLLVAGCLLIGLTVVVLDLIAVSRMLRTEDRAAADERPAVDTGAVAAAARQLPIGEARLAVEMLIDPQRRVLRISESASPEGGHVRIESRVTVSITEDGLPRCVPLLLVERGRLLNSLEIEDESGSRLSSVGAERQAAYLAAVFRKLVLRRSNRGLYLRDLEPLLLAMLAARGRFEAQQYEQLTELLLSCNNEDRPPADFVSALLLLRELRTRAPLMVEPVAAQNRTPGPGWTRFTIRQDLAYVESRGSSDSRWRQTRRAVQLFGLSVLGLRPNRVSVPMENAERARSYHLQVTAPSDEVYLIEQGPGGLGDTGFVVEPRRGQSFSHVYVQEGTNFLGRNWMVRFAEVPPGSTGTALIAAVAVLIGVLVLGFRQLHWVPDGGLNASALAVALPGLVGAFAGVRQSGRYFLGGSARARSSSLLSLAVVVVSLVSASTVQRKASYTPGLTFEDLHGLPPVFLFWSVVVALQVLNTVYVLGLFLFRSGVFTAVRARRGAAD